MIAKEAATVYRGGGRRFFTLRAACRAEAKALIFARWPCDCDADEPEVGYSGNTCYAHQEHIYGRFLRRVERLVRRGFTEALKPNQHGGISAPSQRGEVPHHV